MQQTNLITKFQPIIVITLYRRYFEFINSVDRIQEIKGELGVDPIIIVVWAVPEIPQFGLMERLLEEGKVHYVLERPLSEFDGWGRPTTPAELLNFKVAVSFIERHFSNYYIILQGADILVKDGIYYWISKEIENYPAILFFWNSGLEIQYAWHTNFFVVKDLRYWPKLEDKYCTDTLETMWAKRLRDEQLNDFLHSHNSRHLKFQEVHSSTRDTIFPGNPNSGVYSFVDGVFKITIFNRIKTYIKRVLQWLKLI